MSENLKIVYVLGRGRSGSTFIEHVISHDCGVVQLGEVRLWPKCYVDTHMCSCGQPKTDCAFWQPVIDTLDGPEQMRAAFQTTMKRSFLINLLLPKFISKRVFPGVVGQLGAFYEHAAKTHGKNILLDSSKNPAFGAALAQSDDVDLRFIHVVRHPLGVVYSWKRQRAKNSDAALHKTRKNLALAALEWTGSNLLCELAKLRAAHGSIVLRYEHLADPNVSRKVVETVRALNSDPDQSPMSHVMSGNPGAASRSTDFRLDEEWRTGLTLLEKLFYGALTYPLFVLYAFRKPSV